MFEPLRMHPVFKETLWGGVKLKRDFNKSDAPDRTAESWELCCHADGMSLVEGGAYDGMDLTQLGRLDHDGFWGKNCAADEFPVLVKIIDAEKDLSIQVHPSDDSAVSGEHGKAEMWYVVDCEPQAFLYFGFSKQIDPEELKQRAEDGTICQVLNRVPVTRGDVFYILPGTIHAIGAGILIAEIQQNSNTTFRVYDYKRKDSDGRTRPLHLERAAQVLSYEPIIPAECRANSGASFPEFTMAEMFSCPYFRAYRLDVYTKVKLRCDGQSFQHLLCVEGQGVLRSGKSELTIHRGDSFFLPAAMGEYEVAGECRLLLSRV